MDQQRTKKPEANTDPAGGQTQPGQPGGGSEVGSGAPDLGELMPKRPETRDECPRDDEPSRH